MTFIQADTGKFRNLALAFNAMRRGGNMPCIMNAANEIAVDAFLNEKIGFMQMPEVVEHTMENSSFITSPDLESLEISDAEARETAIEYIIKLKQ
jgi:1-deoxy-D-xylulose-5-phosphate reductoisomerase